MKKALLRKNYEIRWVSPHIKIDEMASAYECAMYALLSEIRTLNVVPVGANDGVINDPLYEFLHSNKDRTKVVLIEPQKYLTEILKKTTHFISMCIFTVVQLRIRIS